MQRIKQLSNTHLRWRKSDATKIWSAGIPTADGIRWVSTHQTEKVKAVEAVRELRLQWAGTDRFQKGVLAAISGVKKTTCERAIVEWADSRRKYGTLSDRSISNYVSQLEAFAKYHRIEKEQPVMISGEMVHDWVNHSGKMGTRRARLAALKSWWGWLVCEHYAVTNHPASIGRIDMSKLTHEEKEPQRAPPFSPQQFNQLLDHIQSIIEKESLEQVAQQQTGHNYGYSLADRLRWLRFWKVSARLGWLVGLRIGDVAQLEWAAFESASVWTDKADTRVTLEEAQELKTLVEHGVGKADECYCFPLARIRYLGNPSQLSQQFTKLCRGAGLDGYSFHSLRRTKAQALQAEGKTVKEIAVALGHKNENVTQIYIQQPEQ